MYDATNSQGASPGMVYTCPHCNGRFDFNTETAPRQIFCPLCGKGFDPVKLETMRYAEGTPPVPSPVEGRTVPQPAQEERLAQGQRLGQFRIEEFIGRGGMGAVYRATQTSLDRAVALKVLPKHMAEDPEFVQRFHREAKALAELNHPNIVSIYDKGSEGGQYFFAMEFVDGVSLRQLMKAGKLGPSEALKLVPQICDALEYAHSRGVIHRDIKPENILVDRAGRLKIADFGLARIVRGDNASTLGGLTRSDVMMGTVNYMAPEQRENAKDVDHRADIYSLGVVIYEMLTGELPIGRFAVPSKKVQVDVRIDDVVLQLLEKDPQARYQRASDVRTSIEQVLSGPPAPACPLSPAGVGTKGPRGAPIAGTVLAMVVAAGLVGALSLRRAPPIPVALILVALLVLVPRQRLRVLAARLARPSVRATGWTAGSILSLVLGCGLLVGATVWTAIHLAMEIKHPFSVEKLHQVGSFDQLHDMLSSIFYFSPRFANAYWVLALSCLGLLALSPFLRTAKGSATAWTTALLSAGLAVAAAASVMFSDIEYRDWLARLVSTLSVPTVLAMFGIAWVVARKSSGPVSEVPPAEAPADRWSVRLYQAAVLLWVAGAVAGLVGDESAKLAMGIIGASLGGVVALGGLAALPRIGGAEDGRGGIRYALFAIGAAAVWPIIWIAGEYSRLGTVEAAAWGSAWLFVAFALLDAFLRPWHRFGRYFGLGGRLERRAWVAIILGSVLAGLLACEFDYHRVASLGSDWHVAALPFVGTIAYTFLVIWGVPLLRTAKAPCPIEGGPLKIEANCPSGAGVSISLGSSAPPVPSVPQTPLPVAQPARVVVEGIPNAADIQAQVRASLAASGIPVAPVPPAVLTDEAALRARHKRKMMWRGLFSHAGAFAICCFAFNAVGMETGWMVWWALGLAIHAGNVLSTTFVLPPTRQERKTRSGRLRKEAHGFFQHLTAFAAVMGCFTWLDHGRFPVWGWWWAMGLGFHAMSFFLDLVFGKKQP